MSDIIFQNLVDSVIQIILRSTTLDNAIRCVKLTHGHKGLQIMTTLCLSAIEL